MLCSSSRFFSCLRGNVSKRLGNILYRGIKTNVSDLRKGDWVEHEGKVLVVNQVHSSHSGRGSRQFQITLKEPVGESLTIIRPNGRETFEKVEMQDVTHQYLYAIDGNVFFLNPKTFEEVSLSVKLMNGNLPILLEGGLEVKIRLNGENPVYVYSPVKALKCTVSKVLEKIVSGDKKNIIIETLGGARVHCSTELAVGDKILVGEDLTYHGRAI